jgi:hypothetical protein
MPRAHKMICVLLANCFFASCATIINKPLEKINIYVSEPSTIVIGKDSLIAYNGHLKIFLPRSPYPVEMHVVNDRLQKKIIINSRNSNAYYSNIIFNFGVWMYVEKDNPKRYTYPSKIFINASDSTIQVHRRKYFHKKRKFRVG